MAVLTDYFLIIIKPATFTKKPYSEAPHPGKIKFYLTRVDGVNYEISGKGPTEIPQHQMEKVSEKDTLELANWVFKDLVEVRQVVASVIGSPLTAEDVIHISFIDVNVI